MCHGLQIRATGGLSFKLNITNQDQIDYLIANFITVIDIDVFLESNNTVEGREFLNSVLESFLEDFNVDLNESFLSPFNIDLELVKPSKENPEPEKVLFMCIYNKLTKTPQFKELFNDVFGDNERLNVKFELVTDLGSDNGGRTQVESYSMDANGKVVGLKQKILINKNWFNSWSDIKIAMAILHEAVHAYLNVKQLECNKNVTLNQINTWDLNDIIDEIYEENNACIFSDEPANQDDHHFMFNNLVPNISDILVELKDDLISVPHQQQAEAITISNPNNNLLSPFDWDDLFKYLAMDGFNETAVFKNNITNNALNNSNYLQYSGIAGQVTKNNCDE